MTDHMPFFIYRESYATMDDALQAIGDPSTGCTGAVINRDALEAWRDERDALRAALRAVCEAAVHTDWTMRGTPHYCAVCDGMEDIDGTTVHADDCPVAAAQALLDGDA